MLGCGQQTKSADVPTEAHEILEQSGKNKPNLLLSSKKRLRPKTS